MWAFDFCNNVVRFQDWILKRRRYIPRGKASKGERAVATALDKHGISYETQYRLGYYVHADFAIHRNGKTFIIEYDGRQHYHPVKNFGGRWRFFLQRWKDSLENLECKDRGYPLLRIRYDVPLEQVESLVMNFLKQNT
jgi:very-short-patch-repair endonuclease